MTAQTQPLFNMHIKLLVPAAIFSLGMATSFAATPAATPTPDQLAAESKRANEFLDRVFDEFVANHPQLESQLGIKAHYDQWNDISDEAAKRDLEMEQKNFAELKRQFDGMDQGIHNYVLHKGRVPNVQTHGNEDGPVLTVAMMPGEEVRRLVFERAEPAKVVHQHDRHPDVRDELEARLGGRTDATPRANQGV